MGPSPPSSHRKLAAAYVRVSTDDQTEYSPAAQLVEIQKYAATHGYSLPSKFIFADEGISGKYAEKRPEFNRMIGTAKEIPKPFDAILLWKFSRFARNRQDSIVYKSILRRDLGIEVISVSEPLADDKMSILMEALIEAMDEYYSINLAEEVRRGMTEKARRGGLQAAPPFGYRAEHNLLVPVPEEAALVRCIFMRFLEGEGLFPLAKWLNGLGASTHRGSPFENRTVEYILRNPAYIGKLRWNPSGRTRRDFSNEHIILADAGHPPLVSLETWEAAQRRMTEVKDRWKPHDRPVTEHKRWLSGLVRCAQCGGTLVFAKPHYWKCNNYVRGSCQASQHIPDDRLTDMILTVLERDTQSNIPITGRPARTSPDQVDEVHLMRERQGQIAVKLERLREAYLAGVENLDGYRSAKSLLEVQSEALSRELREIPTSANAPKAENLLKKRMGRCLDVLTDPDSSMEEKHRAAHAAIDRCVFNRAENTLRIFYRLYPLESQSIGVWRTGR